MYNTIPSYKQQKLPTVFIATPAYGGFVKVGYVNTLLDCLQACQGAVGFVGNSSIVQIARNTLFTIYTRIKKQFEYLFFLDADIELQPGALQRLLRHKKPVVGVAIPMKAYTKYGIPPFAVGDILDTEKTYDGLKLYRVNVIPTAALLIHRSVVETIEDFAKQHADEYIAKNINYFVKRVDGSVKNDFDPETIYNVFQILKDGETIIGEDVFFSKLLTKLDIPIFCDPYIGVRHYGDNSFDGIFEEYLEIMSMQNDSMKEDDRNDSEDEHIR